MLRFIVRRRVRSEYSGASFETLATYDVSAPDLERALARGGHGESGYDITELIGVSVLGGDDVPPDDDGIVF